MSGTGTSDVRIVIVDSDVQNLVNLGLVFQQCGYNNVTYLQTAEDALWLLQQTPIDILMCEAFLPTATTNDGGFQLLSAVKESNFFSSVQVVLFSNSHAMGLGHEIAVSALELGACAFYWKPISIEIVQHLWQHAFVKKIEFCNEFIAPPPPPVISTNLTNLQGPTMSCCVNSAEQLQGPTMSCTMSCCVNNSAEQVSKRSKVMKKRCSIDAAAANLKKKQRLRWTEDLKRKFDAALEAICRTDQEATPSRILGLMKGMGEDLGGLTAPQISSHLQRYKKQKINALSNFLLA